MNSLDNGILIQLGFLKSQPNVSAWPCFNTSLLDVEQHLQHQHLCKLLNFKGASWSPGWIWRCAKRHLAACDQCPSTYNHLNNFNASEGWWQLSMQTCKCQSSFSTLFTWMSLQNNLYPWVIFVRCFLTSKASCELQINLIECKFNADNIIYGDISLAPVMRYKGMPACLLCADVFFF